MNTETMSRRLKIAGVVNLIFGMSLALAALPAVSYTHLTLPTTPYV